MISKVTTVKITPLFILIKLQSGITKRGTSRFFACFSIKYRVRGIFNKEFFVKSVLSAAGSICRNRSRGEILCRNRRKNVTKKTRKMNHIVGKMKIDLIIMELKKHYVEKNIPIDSHQKESS